MADDKTTNDAANATDENKEEPKGPVRGKLLTADEISDWGNEAVLQEKPVKTEANVLRDEIEGAANAGDTEPEDDENKPTALVTATSLEEEQLNDVETIELNDPGEYKSADYSFSVTVFDAEGNKPKTIKVNSIEQWDELLESEPNLGSSAAVSKSFRAAQKMENNLERDYDNWSKQTEEYQQAVQQEQTRIQQQDSIFNEMQYLSTRGDLPQLTNEEMNQLDWEDKAVVKAHPNIAPHRELLNYMRRENTNRAKNKLQPLSSVLDAFNAMQLDTRRKSEVEARKAAGEARKQAGARIAGTTPNPVSSATPRGVAVGRVGDLSRLGQNWDV